MSWPATSSRPWAAIGLRVGINTGEVVVSADNTDVVGDPVNVAARLQTEAHDGEVVIGESTRRLVAALVTLAPLGSFALKGRVESLDRPVAATTAAFVGRDDELARISAVYEAALATPAARLAVLLGSPGLGKSRLIEEVTRRLADTPSVVTAHCDAAGGATFAPVAAGLREFLLGGEQGAGVPLLTKEGLGEVALPPTLPPPGPLLGKEGEEGTSLRVALEAAIPAVDAERTRIINGITALLAGSPASPEETFFIIRRFLAALAATRPIVLVIDDLQWAEPLLLDLVEHLVQWGSGTPLLVLVGARPELRDLRSSLATPGGVGSTPLSQQLDAEEWRDVISRYQRAATEAVEKFGGHVAKNLGDGLLIYFGWPTAREDDPERAVRAGLAIVEAVRALNERLHPSPPPFAEVLTGGGDRSLPTSPREWVPSSANTSVSGGGSGWRPLLAVRIGMHTGPVVIADGGEVFGETANVSARVQAAAEPDTVVITAATQRLVAGLFVVEDRGAQHLKGVRELVTLYRVVQASGVRSRLAVAAGHLTRFVGREVELTTLIDRWERAQDGEGQNVVVLGEAGVGKSRLVYQLHEHLASVPHTWLECGATPYTEGTPFHPIIALASQGLAFAPEDSAADKLGKLENGLGALASTETVALLADFLGLPPPTRLQLSPELQRRKTIDLLARWNLALSEVQPLVLFVEDLHWCDVSTLELLGHLIAQSPTARGLLLATARPEFVPPWPARSNLTTVQLARLTKRQAREMVERLAGQGRQVGTPAPLEQGQEGRSAEERSNEGAQASPAAHLIPNEVLKQLVARADGIPLYLEELTKTVLESGAAWNVEAIPASLADSLMARLDRLSAAKEVAQRAAVLGRELGYPLLAATASMD